MKRPPWLTKEVIGWAMFDFANQSFTLVILTAMYQVYFINFVVRDNESLGRQLWAAAGIISLLMTIVISPLIGALADFSGAKKRLLFVTYVVSVLFTAGLGLIAPGMVAFGMVFFIVGYVFYATGENFVGSFLPELASHRDMGKVSAFGWTISYVGGLVSLAGAALIMYVWPGVTGYRLVCLWSGLFFFAAGLPTFILLRERKQAETLPPDQTMFTIGFHRLAETFHSIRHYRQLFRYLAIMTFYLGGMQIVIWFAGTIAKKLHHFTDVQMAIFMLQITVTAIVGAWITGQYQDRIGTRLTILLSLALWAVVMLGAAFIESKTVFWVLSNGVGFGMGALGTSSRAMVGLFSPAHKAAEFFGFYGIGTKIAAILGLVLSIAAENLFVGRYNLVVASSAVFFIVGLFLMLSVDEKAGRIAALKSSRAFQRRQREFLLAPASIGRIDG